MSNTTYAKLFNLICDGINDFEKVPLCTYLPHIVAAISDMVHTKEKIKHFINLNVTNGELRVELEKLLSIQ
jgi:hypothetical protein